MQRYAGGRLYPFPRLQDAVTSFLASALDLEEAPVAAFLFPAVSDGRHESCKGVAQPSAPEMREPGFDRAQGSRCDDDAKPS